MARAPIISSDYPRSPNTPAGAGSRRLIWALPFVLVIAVGATLAVVAPEWRTDRVTGEATSADPSPGVAGTVAVPQVVRSGASSDFAADGEIARGVAVEPDETEAGNPALIRIGVATHDTVTDRANEPLTRDVRLDIEPGLREDESTRRTEVVVVRGHRSDDQDDGQTSVEPSESPSITVSGTSFAICRQTPFIDCVVDGGTFLHRGEIVRISDVVAPRTDQADCLHEATLGSRAAYRMLALLNAGAFVLEPVDASLPDDDGGSLRLVTRDARSLGAILVDEGLARARDGSQIVWCE